MDSSSQNPASADRPGRTAEVVPSPAGSALRASDQDRDEVAAVLGEALASGRLTSPEHAERIEAVYAARTMGELAPLTGDLPDTRTSASAGSALAATTIEHQRVTATFSKVNRGGRWVAGRHTELRSTFGALIVDLRDAVLPGREIVLEANSFCGKLIVTVPANARIIDEGGVLFGKRLVGGSRRKDGDEIDDDGPLIRVTGQVRFGKVVIRRAGASDGPWWMGMVGGWRPQQHADTTVKVNGAAPGHVATDFNNHRGTRTPEEAAVVVLRLATLGTDGPTGAVFQDDEQLAW